MADIYNRQRWGKLIFMAISIVAIIVFLLISNNLVKDLSRQERDRMEIWAEATRRLSSATENSDYDFLFSIIEQNHSIPVMVVDKDGHILMHRNFSLPDKGQEQVFSYDELSEQNRGYLSKKLAHLRQTHNVIILKIDNRANQYIYYEDSFLLKRLNYYPYVQLSVMIVLAIIVYSAIIYTKRAEQNRVWVGLSKETAHQLGTPISSLMAWTELLPAYGIDKDVVSEMDKDVHRLSVIAERFSKIGSRPELKLEYINETVSNSLMYMQSRISDRVKLTMNLDSDDYGVMMSTALIEWVMENLTKNAVDAMDGVGDITVSTGRDKDVAFVEVKDTGKGILRKNFKNVFNPGFTSKKRGWGLGLTLVKRIIEDYHSGKIFVKESEIGNGTTFRIEMPLAKGNR